MLSVDGSVLWPGSSSWVCQRLAERTQVSLWDSLCSRLAWVRGFSRHCRALNVTGTTLSGQVSRVLDFSEADAEHPWCLINAWETCLPSSVRCNWFGHLLWIPHLRLLTSVLNFQLQGEQGDALLQPFSVNLGLSRCCCCPCQKAWVACWHFMAFPSEGASTLQSLCLKDC